MVVGRWSKLSIALQVVAVLLLSIVVAGMTITAPMRRSVESWLAWD